MNPQLLYAYYNLGISLYDINKVEEAMELWRKAIEIKPQYPKAYIRLGFAYE